jgi:ATP-dependent helicase/DNAse subunit B
VPITLLTGPANAGKAQLVLERVRMHVARADAPILVVPTRADAEHYLRELAGEGTAIGVRVERFAGLTEEAARRAGVAEPVLGETARERILELVCPRLGAARATPGVLAALGELFAELQARRVSAGRWRRAVSALAAADGAAAPELGELGEAYAGYLSTLTRLGRLDPEQRSVRALDGLRERPHLWGATPVLFYGFDDLTHLQLDAVETIGQVVGAPVVVALTYEPGRAAFAGRARTVEALKPLAAEHRMLAARAEHYAPAARGALGHLERSLFEPEAARADPAGAVRLLEGGGERAELELVAEEILALLAADVAAAEIAVLLRGGGAMADLAHEVLSAAGIAAAVRRRRRVGDTALGRGLVGLLRCVPDRDGTPRGAAGDLIAWLRTPGLLEVPALADTLERRATRSGAYDAASARAMWEERHWPLEAIDRLAAAQARGARQLLDRAARELQQLFCAPRRAQASVLAAGELEDARALRAVAGAIAELQELARAAPALASSDAGELAATLERLEFHTAERPGPDEVTVLDPLELRARRVRALFVCGLQEGTFPAPGAPRALVSDEQRRELARLSGIVLDRDEDALASERYLLYAAVSRPQERLTLSWHVADDDGDPRARSLFVEDVCDVFDEALLAARRRRALGSVAPVAGAVATPAPRGATAAACADAGELRDEEILAGLRDRAWSASSLEAWLACPVSWYVERLLVPAALEPDAEPLVRGGIAHAALHETLDGLRRETGSARVTPSTLPVARRLLTAALARAQAGQPLSVAPVRRAAIARRLQLDLERFLEHSAGCGGSLEPAELELGFGFDPGDERGEGSTLPAFDLGGGVMLRGRIDRVDVAPSGAAVVVDYKSSSASPAARWMTDRTIQVALYMLAVEGLLGRPVAGGLYQPLSGRDLRARGALDGDAGVEAACMDEDVLEADQVRGLLADAAEAARAVAREAARGALQARPATCSRGGRCSYPTICRCER